MSHRVISSLGMSASRTTIYIDADLLARVDEAAELQERSRSWFVRKALEAALAGSGVVPSRAHLETSRHTSSVVSPRAPDFIEAKGN